MPAGSGVPGSKAMSGRGPAGSPDLWENVQALLVVSKSTFLPRFLANRTEDVKYTVWPLWPAYQETWLSPRVEPSAVSGKARLDEVVDQFASNKFTLSDNLLKLAQEAATRLEARNGEDIDEWAKRLGEDLGKFKD